MARFIHAADLHLDSPFKGLVEMPEKILKEVRHSTFAALNNLTDVAITEKVDFVVMSGDIYDLDDRSIRAQAYFRNQMLKLEKQHIPVFLIHGNHDFSGSNSTHMTLPKNVYTFSATPETKMIHLNNGEKVAVTGFSYDTKWITERKIETYPTRTVDADWQIGMLHGFSEGSESGHATYAPFSLEELRSKGYDYWALGHIHKRQKISETPLAYYSGNTQGRNKKENGEKGFLLVELSPYDKKVTFIPSATIQWETLSIDASCLYDLTGILSKIEEAMESVKQMSINVILTIELTLPDDLESTLRKKIVSGELLRALQTENQTNPFIWVNQLKVRVGKKEKERSALATTFEKEWEKAIQDTNAESTMSLILEDFFRNAPSMSMLPLHDEEYRNDLLNEAIQLIHTAVGNED